MTSTTLAQFAAELKLPMNVLKDQLSAAGVNVASPSDQVTESDKAKLLESLRRAHASTGKLSLTRSLQPTLALGKVPSANKVHAVRVKRTPLKTKGDENDSADIPVVTNIAIASLGPDTGVKQKTIRWSKLKSIEIKNFKAIEQMVVPLSDVTIMVGPNGSGKSSVLQAIHWAARAASYIPPQSQSEVVSFDRLDYSPSSEPLKTAHRSELASERSTEPTSVMFNHVSSEDGSAAAATVKIWAARNRGAISVYIEGGAAVTPFKQREEVITAYIPGLAGLAEKETILVQPLLRRQAAGGDAGGVLRNVLFNIASRQPGELDNSQAMQRVKRLNEFVQSVHPDVAIEVSFDDREDINIQALFDDRLLSGVKRPLETAATGVLQVIQIFAYLILFRPKLLLVDEPDAHLHPDKQERLIESLEQATAEFGVQAMLTTHSPHIVRAASSRSSLVWIKGGQTVDRDEDVIRALLGWGGLDKKILFFVEDENDQSIRAILRQWPQLNRQVAICRCFGVDNLPRNAMLNGLLDGSSFGVSVIIHRDRDFMTDTESQVWASRYQAHDRVAWVTDYVDAEAYYCQPDYLAALYDVSIAIASSWVEKAVQRCAKTKDVFFDKRKVINKMLYEDGGSPASADLWKHGGEASGTTVVGKTLHKALKVILKDAGYDDKKLDKFYIPKGFEMAPKLKLILENMLSSTGADVNGNVYVPA